jgi:hypothetical protein
MAETCASALLLQMWHCFSVVSLSDNSNLTLLEMHQCGRCSSKVLCSCSGGESIKRTAALCLSSVQQDRLLQTLLPIIYDRLHVSFNTITLQCEITSFNNVRISQCRVDLPFLWRIFYTWKTNSSEADVPHLPLLSPVLLGLPWGAIRLSELRI